MTMRVRLQKLVKGYPYSLDIQFNIGLICFWLRGVQGVPGHAKEQRRYATHRKGLHLDLRPMEENEITIFGLPGF